MRFVTYTSGTSGPRAGVAGDRGVHPLPSGVTVRDLLDAGTLTDAGADAVRTSAPVPLEDVTLRPPLVPASIRDFVAFEAHVEGVARAQEGSESVPAAWYEAPAFYFTNPHAGVATGEPVPIFGGSTAFDFECEVAAVIGTSGRDLTPEDARAHIAGYTLFNDWSARDMQQREGRLPFGFAKGKDGAHTLGPWLVTADELEPHRAVDGYLDLAMTVELNGAVIGTDTLANMAWPFEELIAYASRGTWVRPGDLIGSGTCRGGCLAELWGRAGRREPPPLAPGDTVTLTVEGIGTVTNPVTAPLPVVPLPPARRRAIRPAR